MIDLDTLLQQLVERGGSDLHLRVGEPPVLRVHGCLQRTDGPRLSAEDTKRLLSSIMNDERRRAFTERLDLEFSHATPSARFRVSVFRQQGQVGAVLRLIPLPVRSVDELGLPPILKGLALQPRGLLLMAGQTGAGKSTTLAALIDYINTQRRVHIITVEDPIEFVHTDKKSAVDQREVGQDTHSFADALRHATRHNPDVLFVSELSDVETVSQALDAAEAGHLVLSAVAATDAARAVEHLTEMFPQEDQRRVRAQIAAVLQGIVSQTLLPRADARGRVPAFEVMVTTPAIRTDIREGRTAHLIADIQTGGQHGMESLDASLMDLVRKKLVRYEDALVKSPNPREFEQRAAALNPAHRPIP